MILCQQRHDFQLKMHHGGMALPEPAGQLSAPQRELTALPRPLSWM